jgi:hypothetical protein
MKLVAVFLIRFILDWLSPTASEQQVFNLINAYRFKNGKPALTYSDSLSRVAKTHAVDLYEHFIYNDKSCNLHSWSKSAKWTGGCIQDNSPNEIWEIMWSKPQEIAGINKPGFEISSMYDPKDTESNPDEVVNGWIQSPGHRNCILEIGWNRKFKQMGVGVYKGVTTVWFTE